MTRKEKLVERLREINQTISGDPEIAHIKADEALLDYINDNAVKAAYGEIGKWYA